MILIKYMQIESLDLDLNWYLSLLEFWFKVFSTASEKQVLYLNENIRIISVSKSQQYNMITDRILHDMSKQTGSTSDTQTFNKYILKNYWSNNNSSKWNQCNASSHLPGLDWQIGLCPGAKALYAIVSTDF